MTALILPKLGMCRTASQAERELLSMGAVEIGSGHFATVYRLSNMVGPSITPLSYYDVCNMTMAPSMPSFDTPREDRVIKIVARKDRAALLVAKAAMATHELDPLAPRVFGVVEFADDSWIAELEKLRALPDNSYKSSITGSSTYNPLPEVVAASPFLSLLAAHKKRDDRYGWDIHAGNVMLRGVQPVVTDPIYYGPDC